MTKLSLQETKLAKQMYRWLLQLADPNATAIYRQLLCLCNPEKRNQVSRDYYSRNKAQHNKLTNRWKLEHPELVCHYSSKRRAKQHSLIEDIQMIAKIYARAAELRQWFDVVVDHIIPLAKGGAHAPENLQIIYAKENASKGARLEFVPSVVFV